MFLIRTTWFASQNPTCIFTKNPTRFFFRKIVQRFLYNIISMFLRNSSILHHLNNSSVIPSEFFKKKSKNCSLIPPGILLEISTMIPSELPTRQDWFVNTLINSSRDSFCNSSRNYGRSAFRTTSILLHG